MIETKTSKLLAAFKKSSVLRGRELTSLGFSRVLVAEATKRGLIERVGRGLYTLRQPDVSEHHSLVQVAQTVDGCVFCLLSACRFHEITTQNPAEVWFAIGPKAWVPKITFVKTRVVRFSGPALTEGVEIHDREGVQLRVYSVAKTIADLFRFRNKYGLDIAVQALRDALVQRKCTINEVMRFARLRRVERSIEPFITAYTSS